MRWSALRSPRWSAALIAALVGLVGAPVPARGAEVGQYCPDSTNPDCEDDECKCSAQTAGDPVSVVYGNTVLRRADVKIAGSVAELRLLRSYTSRDGTWAHLNSVANVPVPFGHSPTNRNSLRWWHNFFSFVDVSSVSVWNTNGRWLQFGSSATCSPKSLTPCWLSRVSGFLSIRERLRVDGPNVGFTLMADDNTKYVYHAPLTPPGFTSPTRFFLTSMVAGSGATTAAVAYTSPVGSNGQPLAGCPLQAPDGGTVAVPYARSVTTEDGEQLLFCT